MDESFFSRNFILENVVLDKIRQVIKTNKTFQKAAKSDKVNYIYFFFPCDFVSKSRVFLIQYPCYHTLKGPIA